MPASSTTSQPAQRTRHECTAFSSPIDALDGVSTKIMSPQLGDGVVASANHMSNYRIDTRTTVPGLTVTSADGAVGDHSI